MRLGIKPPARKANRCAGWTMLRWKSATGLVSMASRTFAKAAGKHRPASGNLRLLRAGTKLCSVCCPWPACPLNGCSSRCALGSSRPNRPKNQLGLSRVFFNSLRLTWCLSLLADAAVLLRCHALLHAPFQQPQHLLRELAPRQGFLDLGAETLPEPKGS